ncbi:MAG: hypothetical protein AAFV53_25040 [Myxococcota bacterium]
MSIPVSSPADRKRLRLEAMLDILAHDLQSPLTGTRGFFNEARDAIGPDDGEIGELLREVDEGLVELAKVAADALRLARCQRTRLILSDLDVGPLFAQEAGLPIHIDAPLPLGRGDRVLFSVALDAVFTQARRLDAAAPLSICAAVEYGKVSYTVSDPNRRWPSIVDRFEPMAIARAMLVRQKGWLKILADGQGCRLWLPAARGASPP